jgi:hypothetical protein
MFLLLLLKTSITPVLLSLEAWRWKKRIQQKFSIAISQFGEAIFHEEIYASQSNTWWVTLALLLVFQQCCLQAAISSSSSASKSCNEFCTIVHFLILLVQPAVFASMSKIIVWAASTNLCCDTGELVAWFCPWSCTAIGSQATPNGHFLLPDWKISMWMFPAVECSMLYDISRRGTIVAYSKVWSNWIVFKLIFIYSCLIQALKSGQNC